MKINLVFHLVSVWLVASCMTSQAQTNKFQLHTINSIYTEVDSIVSKMNKMDSDHAVDRKRTLDINLHYPDTVVLEYKFLPIVFTENSWDIMNFMPPSPIQYNQAPFSVDKFYPRLFSGKGSVGPIKKDLQHYIIRERYDLVRYSYESLPQKMEPVEEIKTNIFHNLFAVEYDPQDDIDKSVRYIPKRRYWTYNGNHSIKFSQSYRSSNWYQGKNDYLNLFSHQRVNINYKKDKVKFENLIEWRLNLYTNENDTLRKTKIGEDVFRTYSTLSMDAIRNWSYLTNLEIKTQLLKNYYENRDDVRAKFLSPIYINMGILGMKYQIDKRYGKKQDRRVNFNADISPLSVAFTYVADSTQVTKTNYGIEEGKDYLLDLGSTINSKVIFNFNSNVKFESRFKYFTNYSKVQIEWENNLDMPLNRFLTATLYFYFRFDDSPNLRQHADLKRIQLSELLALGFSYSW